MIENVGEDLGRFGSDSTLSDLISAVEKLADCVGYNPSEVRRAKRAIGGVSRR
jgi:hypothetical protein